MSAPEWRYELTPLTYERWRIVWTDGTFVDRFY